MIKARRLKYAGHVAHREKLLVIKNVVWKYEAKMSLRDVGIDEV
jgi:hypothetical protein